ncbi:hypothetical protein TEA_024416 [Camellia sinensis var. sinensis]|uniref:Uncharacterized protein n=1 Tax=Camellia sinensis var. sinensis TaxID=542762 RepID=A0A4S4D1C9_CAMSN|nr:hypothetical protein TEA_024416 [Camellia sinensis var. sinensis]
MKMNITKQSSRISRSFSAIASTTTNKTLTFAAIDSSVNNKWRQEAHRMRKINEVGWSSAATDKSGSGDEIMIRVLISGFGFGRLKMSSSVAKETQSGAGDEGFSLELPAPPGWTKKLVWPFKVLPDIKSFLGQLTARTEETFATTILYMGPMLSLSEVVYFSGD